MVPAARRRCDAGTEVKRRAPWRCSLGERAEPGRQRPQVAQRDGVSWPSRRRAAPSAGPPGSPSRAPPRARAPRAPRARFAVHGRGRGRQAGDAQDAKARAGVGVLVLGARDVWEAAIAAAVDAVQDEVTGAARHAGAGGHRGDVRDRPDVIDTQER